MGKKRPVRCNQNADISQKDEKKNGHGKDKWTEWKLLDEQYICEKMSDETETNYA